MDAAWIAASRMVHVILGAFSHGAEIFTSYSIPYLAQDAIPDTLLSFAVRVERVSDPNPQGINIPR
jgi:hypothetical protein